MFNIKLPKEQKDEMIERIQTYFWEERSEQLGAIAAESMLDFMIRVIGPQIYNAAVQDARKLVNDRMLAMEDELYTLEKPTSFKDRR